MASLVFGVFAGVLVRADTTYVSGHISANTIWNVAGSPYVIYGDIIVDSLITLTIEPGVKVIILENRSFTIYGILIAKGTEVDSIIIDTDNILHRWKKLEFCSGSSGNLRYVRISYGDRGCKIMAPFDSITHCNISRNWGGIGISGSGSIGTIAHNNILENSEYGISNSGMINMVKENTFSNSYDGILNYGQIQTVRENTLINNTRGITNKNSIGSIAKNIMQGSGGWKSAGILNEGSIETIRGNEIKGYNEAIKNCPGASLDTICNNTITGKIINYYGASVIREIKFNTLNPGLIIAQSSIALACSNNIAGDTTFEHPSGFYAFKNLTPHDIDAQYNYWYTTDAGEIDNRIYDHWDNHEYGEIHFIPFLTDEHSIEEFLETLPSKFELFETYPNPFTTVISVKCLRISEKQKLGYRFTI
ncbi:MAG: hypothetical protein QMD71_01700 [bacterium]|nr:hypothetical protein [bacterium]